MEKRRRVELCAKESFAACRITFYVATLFVSFSFFFSSFSLYLGFFQDTVSRL